MTNLQAKLKQFIQALTDIAAEVGPVLAPIPTAYAIGTSLINNLHYPAWVGIATAIAVESLGLATVNTALMLREYNASKLKSDPVAPFKLAAALIGLYLSIAVILAGLLDTAPQLAQWTPIALPFLSLPGVTVLGLRSNHRQRLTQVAQAADKRRKTRTENRQADLLLAQTTVKPTQGLTTDARRTQLLDIWRQGKGQVFTHLAQEFDVSRQTISNDFTTLRKAGQVKRNGSGIEVLA